MKEIDTSSWGEFRVGELFEIAPTKAYKLTNDFLFDGGDNPVVVNSSQNNGVGGFTSQELTEERGAITFSDTTDAASIFYQDQPFVGYPHVQAMRLHDDVERSGLAMLYIAGVFKAVALLQGYDYANKFTRVSAAQLVLKLPVTPDGDPDWDAMEQTMREVTDRMATNLDALTALPADTTMGQINVGQWGDFRIGELFEVGTGSLIPRSELIDAEDGLPRVSVSGINNGIVGCYVCSSGALRVFENFISVSFLGSVFYQPQEASLEMKVHALQPRGVTLTENTGSFLVACVEASLRQWRASSYSDQISSKLLPDVPIRLPATPAGDPDWGVMEQTMREVTERMAANLDALEGLAM